MKKQHVLLLGWAVGIAMQLAACGNRERDATEAAINAAETAINASQGAADRIVPEQIKAAQDALETARKAFAMGDYPAALNGTRDATQKARAAVTSAANMKEEWAKEWDILNASVPKMLTDAQIKVDVYKKYGRLPKGIGSENMELAAAQIDPLKQQWADAKAAHKSGNLRDAMAKTRVFKENLQKLQELLTAPK